MKLIYDSIINETEKTKSINIDIRIGSIFPGVDPKIVDEAFEMMEQLPINYEDPLLPSVQLIPVDSNGNVTLTFNQNMLYP